MKPLRTLVVLLFCFVLFGSWGFLMHRSINQLAVYTLPTPLRNFMWANVEYMVKESVRPDQRRNKDSTEAPKHFIDLEAFGPNAANDMPLRWEDAVRKYGVDSLKEYGYVPYHIMTVQRQLTAAMRAGKWDSILFYAADLGHYVSDAHVPLHTTLNYDGQLTNQKGLHSLWESTVPELQLSTYKLYTSQKAKYLRKPEEAIWNAVRKAHKEVPKLLQLERDISKNFTDSTKYRIQMRNGREVRSYSTAFARAYGEKIKASVQRQNLRSVRLLGDLWYTAWVDAGKPALQNASPFTTAQRDSLNVELKYFKKNQLLQRGKLISRRERNEE